MDNTQYYPIEFDESGAVFTVINNGTAPAPCIITIIPKVDIMKLSIVGLTEEPIYFSAVKANQVFEINGEERTVILDGNNAITDYDAWEFPRLLPGENQIVIEHGAQMSISIEYSANYI